MDIVAVIESLGLEGKDHELICAMLKDFERCGYAKKACIKLLKNIHDDPSIRRVIGCVDRANTPSIALTKSLGGKFLQPRGIADKNQDIYVFQ